MRKCSRTRFLALLAALSLTASLAAPALASGGTVTISDVESFLEFAKNCSLDTWSQGKTVVLTGNIDLGGEEFTAIPTFGGTFLGQGHTITGLRITAAGSNQGLFRFIQPDGVVQDLTVQGTVAPDGTRSTVGGIAGDNSGTLRNCTFNGTVKGQTMVGGIAGRNNTTGQIIDCKSGGSITGENSTGGIAGRSLGVLLKCENNAGVNLTDSEAQSESLDVDTDAVLNGTVSEDDAYRLLDSCFDTGGIVGHSSGVIQSCTNNGAVGYPHVGYNTGGIAGRQSGYISGCVNNGVINGRKDVGGIAGQAEPYMLLDPSGDTLERLHAELNTLDGLITQALQNAQQNGNAISSRLESIGNYTSNARSSSRQMLNNVSDFADQNIAAVDTVVSDVTNALEKVSPALDDLTHVGGQLTELSGRIWEALDALGSALDTGDQSMQDILEAIERLRQAGGDLNLAAESIQQAVDALRRSLLSGVDGDIISALAQLHSAAAQLSDAFTAAGTAIRDLHAALKNGTDLPPALEEARNALEAIGPALEAISAALRQIDAAMPTHPSGWKESQSALRQAFASLRDSGLSLDDALSALQDALGRSGELGDSLGDALNRMQEAADNAASIGGLLWGAFDKIGNAIDSLTGSGPAAFKPLGEDFRQASDSLYDAMSGLSGELSSLNAAVQSSTNALTDDLLAVNNQFRVVTGVLVEAVTGLRTSVEEGFDTLIEDTSEEDIEATREGKVADCRNTGPVDGDRNVGGAVGAMAIEFDLDPEDDTSNLLHFGRTYETKAVLQGCVNQGAVTGKKDCVGGLAGRMDMGTALDCENYGPVASTGGDYVGGIAGLADANLRSCWAKNTLSGGNYIGGITGWASRLRDCRAIVTITEGTEYLGAISGGMEADGSLEGNLFVDTGTAAIDGVSYTGKAGPVTFDELSRMEGVPQAFTTFHLTLLADGRQVKQIPFRYGEDLSKLELPEVPQKPGSYGVWPDFDTSGRESDITLEAVYAPWVTLVASEETSGELPLALAEGQFTQDAVLHAESVLQAPPEGGGGYPVAWSVSLTGTDLPANASVPIRLLDTTGGTGEVWQQREGRWQPVHAARNGQYLLLTMDGTEGTYCIQPAEENEWLLPAATGAGTMLLIVLLLLALRRLRRRHGKKKQNVKTEAGD